MSDDENQDKGKPEVVDNVIRFPVERVKSKRKLKKLAGKLNDNRKATLFLSLLSVLVMSAYLLQNMGEGVNREMASTDARDRVKEKALASQLLNPNKRTPASYGRRPSAEERFRTDLGNRYRELRHEETGMLTEAVLREGREPIQINDIGRRYTDELKGFLMSYSDHIHPGYDDVEPFADADEVSLTAHSYNLLQDGRAVGRIRFELDQSGFLRSIKVQAIQKP